MRQGSCIPVYEKGTLVTIRNRKQEGRARCPMLLKSHWVHTGDAIHPALRREWSGQRDYHWVRVFIGCHTPLHG